VHDLGTHAAFAHEHAAFDQILDRAAGDPPGHAEAFGEVDLVLDAGADADLALLEELLQAAGDLEELLPIFEREGVRLVLEPDPDDFVEDGIAGVNLVKGINSPLVTFLYRAPHTFHQGGDLAAVMRHAGPLLTQVHIADSFDHRGSSGLRYIVNPLGSTVRVHQHLDIGQGEVDWDLFFRTLAEVSFDGIATVCVFAWEERAADSGRFNLEQVNQYVAKYAR
jgi:myo-inositol catabolism protein IolH